MKRFIITTLLILAIATAATAKQDTQAAALNDSTTVSETRKKPLISFRKRGTEELQRIVTEGDTMDVLIPRFSIGRFDRGLFNHLFIPKGQWGFGLTASYGEFNTEDIQVLSILKDFNFKGKIYSLSPSVMYFVRNNQAVGMRFDYQRATADLGGLAIDFDEDINFSIKDVSYYSQSYSLAAFYRAYVGLGSLKRFGIFNEVELSMTSGTSRFKRIYNGEPRDTRTITTGAALNFSPGVTMFIMDYVSFNVSFGVFGLHFNREKQTTDGVDEGSRFNSGANFKFNLFNIKFGVSVYI